MPVTINTNDTIEAVKISELTEVSSYVNLYTIGTDGYLRSVKVPLSILGQIGDPSQLQTTDKSSLVAAINEAATTGGGGGGSNLTGYVEVDSIANLPVPGQATLGYLVGSNLYLYVGTGGDTKNGAYQNCGPFRGPQGPQGIDGIQGPIGPAGVTSVVVTVDNTTGPPTAVSTLVSGLLSIAFSGLKGEQGEMPSDIGNLVYIGVNEGPTTLPLPNYEETTNKVIALSNQSTDTQYPSAKCVYDALANKQGKIDIYNKVDYLYIDNVPISTSIETDAGSDTKMTSPKAVKTYVDSVMGDIETLLAAI